MTLLLYYSVLVLIVKGNDSLDCSSICVETPHMRPLWIKAPDGVCFLAPNECAMRRIQCVDPNHGFYEVTDGSCGKVPKEAMHGHVHHEEL